MEKQGGKSPNRYKITLNKLYLSLKLTYDVSLHKTSSKEVD